MFEASTPISSTIATKNESFTLADEINKYKTHILIEFLQKEENLKLDDDDLKIIRKEKTLKDLKEVLAKYRIDGNGISAICQFPLKIYTLEDNDEELIQCVKEIKHRLKNMRTLLADSNEAMHEENTGHVDYAVKILEELICITEGKLYQVVIGFAQNLVQCENALQVNKKQGSEEEKELFRNVKRMIEVVVSLLKDRVDVEKEPAIKKQ
ncbi:hypothetical protein C1646_754026 [Rhizophagus diaphanus]|nr:hypothetical protein C1646_754026 [Rhizophagus diaphanus] [Rhizophagus sp. MUCL 43196]